jgi:hypothetical protein
MKNSRPLVLIFLFVIASCSSVGKKERDSLRGMFQKGEYTKAIEFVDKTKFYKDKKSRLLGYLEKGLLYHAKGDLYQSTRELNKARDLSQKLYTKSIKALLKSYAANDTFDLYYGESYERSMIHYYLSLNHFLLYQRGYYEAYSEGKEKVIPQKNLSQQERRRELFSARAEILAWDSYTKSLKSDKLGSSVYKNDLLAKTVGAFIHEAFDKSADNQIAFVLYQDARKILFRNYNSYRAFNKLSQNFKKDFSKLPSLKKAQVEKKYTIKTENYNDLKNFLDFKILTMAYKVRPRSVKSLIRKFDIDKVVVKKAKIERKKNHNVAVIVERGLIPKKVADKQYYGLMSAMSDPKSSGMSKVAASIGSAVLTVYAAKQLGLLPPPSNYSPVGAYMGLNVASTAVNNVSISFELPKIEEVNYQERYQLVVYNSQGKKIRTQKLPLINPMGDIAKEAIEEKSAFLFPKIGVRLALKHITAIAASYGTYKLIKGKSGEFFAKTAAVLQYTASNKAIENSERADIRNWTTLPKEYRFTQLSLAPGNYKLSLVNIDTKNAIKNERNLGAFKVSSSKKKKLLNYRVP